MGLMLLRGVLRVSGMEAPSLMVVAARLALVLLLLSCWRKVRQGGRLADSNHSGGSGGRQTATVLDRGVADTRTNWPQDSSPVMSALSAAMLVGWDVSKLQTISAYDLSNQPY